MTTEFSHIDTVDDGKPGSGRPDVAPSLYGFPRNEASPADDQSINAAISDGVERSAELAWLKEAPAGSTTLLYGPAGLGKRYLMGQLARSSSTAEGRAWTLRGSHPALFAADVAAMSSALGIRGAGINGQEALVCAAKEWLSQHGDWLLFIHNLAKPGLLEQIVPDSFEGRVMVTAPRLPVDSDRLDRQRRLTAFTPGESRAFFRSRAVEGSQWDEVGTLLSHVPLAIEIASKLACCSGLDSKSLCDRLEARVADVRTLQLDGPESEAVTLICAIALAEIRRHDPAALALVRLCSFLSSEPMPIWGLERGSPVIKGRLREVLSVLPRLKEMVRLLEHHGLVRIEGAEYTMHEAVQTAVRSLTVFGDRAAWARAAARLIGHVFPASNMTVASKRECLVFLPHALAACGHVQAYGKGLDEAGQLLTRAGFFLKTCTAYREAAGCYEGALEAGKQLFGATHPQIAVRTNNLGAVLQASGDYPRAETCFQQALDIARAACGPDHPHVVSCLNNLSGLYEVSGTPEKALNAAQDALDILERTRGKYDLYTGEQVNRVGEILRSMGDLDKARECFEQAIQIDTVACKPEHRNWSFHARNLAHVLVAQEQLDRACEYLQKSLETNRLFYGDRHTEVARDLYDLGLLLSNLGRTGEARECYEEALQIMEGVEHGDAALMVTLYNQVGHVNALEKHFARAAHCFSRALALGEEFSVGPEELVRSLSNLGIAQKGQGDLEQARSTFERVLPMVEQCYGNRSAKYASALSSLGGVFKEMGDYDQALHYYRQAVAVGVAVHGRQHESVGRDMYNVGSVMKARGELPEALAHMTRAHAILEATLGADHPRTRRVARRIWRLEQGGAT